jgi:cell division protein FtsL
MRLVHLMVIGALIVAASLVYKIKFDSTLQAERAAKLSAELRREHDAIAALRAEWARLETPSRIEALARRHLQLQPLTAPQIGDLGRLPERPPPAVAPADPLGAMIEPPDNTATGSVAPAR